MQYHDAYGKQSFDTSDCFLCGACSGDAITEEHVFPKWLQRNYSLWNRTIGLLNGSAIRYRELRVPCCKKCNQRHLSAIESQISRAVRIGYQASVKVHEHTWYLWAAKIFYGILRKELSLLADRMNPAMGTIVSEEVLRSFSNLHLFLQGIRGRHQFAGPTPYTVLICNLHDIREQFDFRDDLIRFSLAFRLKEVGVIVCFEDGGLIRQTYANYVRQVAGRKLHPIQFAELYAKVSYQLGRRVRPLKFLTASDSEGNRIARTSMVVSSTELMEWDQQKFAEVLRLHLASYLSSPALVKFEPPDIVSTWMTDDYGNPRILPLEAWGGT